MDNFTRQTFDKVQKKFGLVAVLLTTPELSADLSFIMQPNHFFSVSRVTFSRQFCSWKEPIDWTVSRVMLSAQLMFLTDLDLKTNEIVS